MLLSEQETKAICERLLSFTKAEDASAGVSSNDLSHLRFAANAFTTCGRREGESASITVWIDKKRGSASASNLEEDSLRMAVAQAEELARLSPVDKEYVPTLGPQTYRATGGYVEATSNLSVAASCPFDRCHHP